MSFPTGQGQAAFAYLPADELPILPGGGGGSSDCGITDDFERVVASGLGVATCGISWTVSSLTAGSTLSVDSGAALLHGNNTPNGQQMGLALTGASPPFDEAAIRTLRFQLPNYDSLWDMTFIWRPSNGYIFGPALFIRESSSWLTYVAGPGVVIATGFWNSTSTYTWSHFRDGLGNTVMTISDGTTTYTAPTGTDPTTTQCSIVMNVQFGSTAPTVRILDIDIPEITACDFCRDEFDRIVSTGVAGGGFGGTGGDWGIWGDGPLGFWTHFGPGLSTSSVDGDNGILQQGLTEGPPGFVNFDYGGGDTSQRLGTSGVTTYPWSHDFTAEMRFMFEIKQNTAFYGHQGGLGIRKVSDNSSPQHAAVYWTMSSSGDAFGVFTPLGSSEVPYSWEQGVWYILNVDRAGTVLRAKVRREDTADAGWLLTMNFDSDWLADELVVTHNSSSSIHHFPDPFQMHKTRYDYLRFGACVTGGGNCEDDITDSFTRTSVDAGWGSVEQGGVSYNNNIAGPQGVTGSEAYLGVISNPTFIPFSQSNTVRLFLPVTPVSPLDISYTVHVDPSFNAFDEDEIDIISVFGTFAIGRHNTSGTWNVDFFTVVSSAEHADGSFSALGIDIHSSFNFRALSTGPGGVVDVYIWQGGVQPPTPTKTIATLSTAPFSTFGVDISKGDWSFGAFKVYIDTLNIISCADTGGGTVEPSEDNPATHAPVVYGQGTVSG